jgi:hypothetical protein
MELPGLVGTPGVCVGVDVQSLCWGHCSHGLLVRLLGVGGLFSGSNILVCLAICVAGWCLLRCFGS